MDIDPNRFSVNAMLCDSAVTAEGKLYIQGGGWATFAAESFPATHPRLGLALVITVPYTATNRNHVLKIQLKAEDGEPLPLGIGPDGEPRFAIGAQFNVGRPPNLTPGDAQPLSFAVNINQLLFSSPGAYSVAIEIDHLEAGNLPFRVVGSQAMTLEAS